MEKQNCKPCKSHNIILPLIGLIILGVVSVSIYSKFTSVNADKLTDRAQASVGSDSMEKSTTSYMAGKFQKYSNAAYANAISDGKIVLLDFHADWCSVCISNGPKLSQAFDNLDDNNLVGFKVNYDSEAELKKAFGVTSQATFILLKDGKEAGRTMGPKSVEDFEKLLLT